LTVFILVTSLYGLVELVLWSVEVLIRKSLGLPSPTASAYYVVNIVNNSTSDLLITLCLLNDKPFHVPCEWQRRQDERVGWLEQEKAILVPSGRTTISLPSKVEPRIGYIMVVAQTRVMNPGLRTAFQKVAVYLLQWSSQPLSIHIKDSDLQTIDLSSHVDTLELHTLPKTESKSREAKSNN